MKRIPESCTRLYKIKKCKRKYEADDNGYRLYGVIHYVIIQMDKNNHYEGE